MIELNKQGHGPNLEKLVLYRIDELMALHPEEKSITNALSQFWSADSLRVIAGREAVCWAEKTIKAIKDSGNDTEKIAGMILQEIKDKEEE